MNVKGVKLKDKYILEKVLGSGGFGVTYLGKNLVLDIPVAVKEFYPEKLVNRESDEGLLVVCKDEYRDDFKKGIEAFLNEARILAGFNNLDGVVDVYDYFEENHTAYIVMEYIDGISVKAYIKKHGYMESGQVLDQMKPIVKALVKIHEKGLVHRDISADNIIYGKDGRLKLIDFGAARKNNIEQKTITVIYKNGFSAPEQYMSHGAIGAYTDIYSLGATFYYMLTGEVPVESVGRVVDDNLKPLSAYTGIDLTGTQISAIEKAMNIKSEDRFQQVSELFDALYEEPIEHVNALHDSETFLFEDNEVKDHTSKSIFTRSFIRRELEKERRSSGFRVKKAWIYLIILLVLLCLGAIAFLYRDQLDKTGEETIVVTEVSTTEASTEVVTEASTEAVTEASTEAVTEATTEAITEAVTGSIEMTTTEGVMTEKKTTEEKTTNTEVSTEKKTSVKSKSEKTTDKKSTTKEKNTKKRKDDTAGDLDDLFD